MPFIFIDNVIILTFYNIECNDLIVMLYFSEKLSYKAVREFFKLYCSVLLSTRTPGANVEVNDTFLI